MRRFSVRENKKIKLRLPRQQVERLLEYYGKKTEECIRTSKYAALGRLLYANAVPGENIWLIRFATWEDCLEHPRQCQVLSVEFQDDNNAAIQVWDPVTEERHWIKNSDWNRVFFSTQEEAENAMERRDTMARKDKYFIVTKGTDRAIMRSDRKRALEKKAELLERFPGREVCIYRAKGKEEDV